MESIKHILFEAPAWGMVILAMAEVVLFAVWLRRRTRRCALALLIPPILAAGLFGLATLVVTDREQIQQALQKIADDFQANRLDATALYLDENYEGFGGDKESLLALAQVTRGKHGIESIKVTRANIHVHGRRANADITTTVKLNNDLGGGAYGFAWKIDWVRREPGWRIQHIDEPEPVVPGFEPGTPTPSR